MEHLITKLILDQSLVGNERKARKSELNDKYFDEYNNFVNKKNAFGRDHIWYSAKGNNLHIYLRSLCFALTAGWWAFESSVLVQFTTMLDPPSTGTHANAIRMLMVMLTMPDLSNITNPDMDCIKLEIATFEFGE